MANIKTVIHAYRFDISKTDEQAAYLSTVETIRSQYSGEAWIMRFVGDYGADKTSHEFINKINTSGARSDNGISIELEILHLFNNQWNSAPFGDFTNGARLFNWCECIYPNKHIKQGYWLDQTAEMREVLRNTYKCGYCGKQEPAAKGYVFCPHCLDSEYLKEADLHLTRMRSVSDDAVARAPLTEAERAHLLPLYRDAQKNGTTERGKKRIAAARRRIETEYKQAVADATEKRDAARWIMDNAPGFIDNWIFYNHSARHCFGWRSKLDSLQVETLLSVISEFPFAYEILCEDGRKLHGD